MRLLAFLLSVCTLISTSTSASPIPIPYNGSYISLPTTDISFTHTIKHFPIWGTLYQVNQDGTPDLSSPILPSTTPPINVFSWITWIRSATSQTSFCQCSDSSPLSPCELSCTNDSYHVTQLLGEPDVYPQYGTNSHAWAPSGNYTADVLELGIAYPMYVSGIEAYETYHPQPITRITTTLHNTSTWYNLWSDSSPSSSTSRIFRPPFCHTRFASDIIRLEVTSVNGTRPEIDAIRVLGTLTLPPGRVRSTQGLVYYVPVQGIESSNFTDFLTYTTFNCTSTSSPSAPVTFQLIPPSTPTYFMTQLYHIVNTRSTIIPINITSVLTDVTTRLKTSLTRDNITIVIHEITGDIRITSPNTTSIVFTTGSTITTSSIAITAGRTASIVTLELRYIITTNDNTYTYRIRYLLCASSYYPLDNQCIACTSIAPSTSAMSTFEYDDFVRYCVAYTSISQGLRIAIYVITAICMAMTVGVIAAVVWYRAHPVIVWSSYKFCLLMLAGCLLVYTHVFLTAAEPSDESCAALPWIGHFSYCLIASCLFSKTYRLYRILNNKDLSSHAMKDWELFLMIAIITGVMGIYLIIWQLIDPLRAITDIYMGTATVTCSSNHSAWTIAALAFDIALLVWGVTLVWKTRKLPDQYNEGRYIAVVIIGVVVIGLISIPIIYFLSASHTAILVVKVIAFLSATTLGVCTIFIPKFYQIYTRPTPVIDPQASRVIEFSSADQSRAALHHVPEAEFPFSNIGADHGLPSIHLREIPVPSELNPFSHPDLDHAMPTHILVKDEDEHKMPASRRPSVARSDISIPVPVPVPVPVPAPITRTHRVFSSSDVDSANPFSNPENDHGLPTSVVEHYHERANRWLEEKSVQPFSHAFLDHGIITPQHHRGRSHDAIATSSSPRPAHHNRYQSQQLLPSHYADSHMSHSPSPIDPTDIFSSIVNDHGVDEEILLEHQARTRAEIEAAHQLEHGKHLILADAMATQQATEEDYQPLNIFSSIDADHGVDDPVLSRTLQQRRASITRSQANSRVASRAVSHQGSPTHRDIPQFTFQVPSVVRPHPRSAMHSRTASQPANVFSDPDAAHDPEWIIERRLIQDGHETATHTVPLSRQHMTQAQIESLNPFSDVDADHAIPADIVERVKQTRSGRSSALSSARTSPHASQARRLPTTTSSHVVNLRLARPGLSASIPSSPTASELGSSNHIPVPYHSTRSSIAHLIGTGHVSGMDKLEVPDVLDDRRASIGSFASLGSTRSLFDVPTDLERRGVSNFGSTSPSGRYASGTRSPTSAIDDQPASPDPTSPVHISHPPPAGYIPTIPESDTQALAGSIQALLRARQSRNSSRPASPIRSNIGSESPSPRPLQIHLPPSDMEYQDIDDDSALAAIMGMGSPRSRPSSPPLLSSPRGRERINTLSLEPSDEIKHK